MVFEKKAILFSALEMVSVHQHLPYQHKHKHQHKSELKSQRKCLRPYHDENTRSRPITEVKHRRAGIVLGWGTAWELPVS